MLASLRFGSFLVALALLVLPVRAEVGVSFSANLQPTLNARCAVCHMTGAEPGGMSLTPERAWADLVGREAIGLPSLQRVSPGDPQASYLMHKLWGSHRTVGGNGSRMPLHQPPLTAALIADFEIWVLAGAPNN